MPRQEQALRGVVGAQPVRDAVLSSVLEEAAAVAPDGLADRFDFLEGLAEGGELSVGEQIGVLAVQDVVALESRDVCRVSYIGRHGPPSDSWLLCGRP